MSLFTTLIPSLNRAPAAASCQPAPAAATDAVRPRYEITEEDAAFALVVHLPGVGKTGLAITDENGVLTIRGERVFKQPAGWTVLYRESSDAVFELALRHDNVIDADKVQAELVDGVLRAVLPKAEARKPRKIAVN